MVNPPEYEDELKELKKLPEEWNKNDKEIILSFIVSREQGTWIIGRIFNFIDRGHVSASIQAKYSPHSVDLIINLNLDVAPVVGVLSVLLFEIKTRLITDCMHNLNHRRERKNFNLR